MGEGEEEEEEEEVEDVAAKKEAIESGGEGLARVKREREAESGAPPQVHEQHGR